MSLPIAVGDLITVINLGFQIYEKCFTKAQAAGKLVIPRRLRDPIDFGGGLTLKLRFRRPEVSSIRGRNSKPQ